MQPLVTLITCTGHRPEALKICNKLMSNQTFQDEVQWVVIDDEAPSDFFEIEIRYRADASAARFNIGKHGGPKLWEPGFNTQRFNLDEAFKHIAGDYILIIEDDDWYHPTYIEEMVNLLQHHDLVGEGNAKYYSLKVPGFKQMHNYQHTSLCQLGMRKEVLPLFYKAIHSGELYIDIALWKKAFEEKLKTCIFTNRQLSIGMKGLPGRPGIGVGHTAKDYMYDAGMKQLEKWIGKDVELYKPFVKG